MATRDLLRDEIDRLLGKMKEMEVGSEEYKIATDSVTKLTIQLNEMDKADSQWGALAKEDERQQAELSLKREQLEHEKKVHADDEAFRAKQTKDEYRKTIINVGVTILGIAVTSVITIWGTNKSLKFEETGTYTSLAGRLFATKSISKK